MNKCSKKSKLKKFSNYILGIILTFLIFLICVFVGSGNFVQDISDSATNLASFFASWNAESLGNIIINVRLPRVICVALIGAGLSVCGVAMQGLLRNPLADGTTLGVSSGASLGAVIAIVAGNAVSQGFVNATGSAFSSEVQSSLTVIMAMLFGFLSLLLIMTLSFRIDSTLSTNTIILIGVIFGMFASAMISLLIALFPEKVQTITFWTMGSVAGVNYGQCVMLAIILIVCVFIVGKLTPELNAFAIGEENASHLGVDVRRSKLIIMITSSILIGACVSVSGTIGFVGLVVPHISRLITGPNNTKVLPFSILFGSSFLMLTDLISRTIIMPKELPIGVITSILGSIIFIYIFTRQKSRQNKI